MAKYPNLEAHKIPFSITMTDAFVQHLMKVAEVRPFLDEQLGTPMEVSLLRRAQVRAITASNQIEGNKLQEKEVTALLKGQKVAGSERDLIEVQNYHEALDYVEQLTKDKRKFSQNDFCDIQKLVTKDVIEKGQSGRIRTIPVSIVNAANGKKIGDCPEPHSLKGLMDDLWKWLDDTKGANPFARAFVFHLIAVTIHPFADGNGRTVRLV
jgi:Fic family protein